MIYPYAYADKVLAKLKKRINAEFVNTINLLPFDELNVAITKEVVNRLYETLASVNHSAFVKTCRCAYKKAYAEATDDVDESKDDSEGIILLLLAMYHPVTEYSYNKEFRRKRDRLIEAILANNDRLVIENAFSKAANLWLRQSAQYVDFAVDEGRKKAFEKAGVKLVEWVAIQDGKCCGECGQLNGMIFPIDDIPNKPHRNCRCFLIPVRDN